MKLLSYIKFSYLYVLNLKYSTHTRIYLTIYIYEHLTTLIH